jgi:GNAT superfamily N-acetyltransferase
LELVLRPIRASDRDLVARAFAGLGAESRYRRFMVPKQALSEAELRQLTAVDGARHFAIGVVAWDVDSKEQPLAIGHFFRSAADSEVAEPAIAVADAVQGRGLGKLLLRRLTREARQRGVRRFCGDVISDNRAIQCLIRGLDPRARFAQSSPGSLQFELVLPDLPQRSCFARKLA